MTTTLRSATRSDALYLLKLEEACMRAYAEALWGAWRPSDTAETLDLSGHEIIELGGRPCGCVAVSWQPDHMFVEKLYIDPAYQGRGIGAVALKAKTSIAAKKGLPTKLSVLTTNPADRFYTREGFTLEAKTPERRRFSKPVE
ncbi:GNAT family N-acetyltransferase [Parasphingorhabdus sp.]|uniref:GNAT family N-acetyltransferase n=1 Tax=Parasphingorhabdus sp. TaxID=2709688 RepID=UPI003A8CC9F8